jgi:curved DNA-binding protein CbpA
MGTKRALIIGSDRDSFLPIEQFLESRGLNTTVVLNYKEGFEKLFYERPDLAIVLELISYKLSPTLIEKINGSGYFEVVDIEKGKIGENLKPVIVLEAERFDALISFLESYLGTSQPSPDFTKAGTEEKGDLKEFSYPKLLLSLYRDKRTGILVISSKVKLKLYIADGIPIFVEGGDFETALGRMLMGSGKISKADHERAVDVAVKNKRRIGDILIEMGLVSPHELNSFLEIQIKEKIMSGLNCLQGAYSFKPDSDIVNRIVGYKINLLQVLYEGIKRFIDISTIEEIFFPNGEGSPEIKLSPDLRVKISGVGFTPRESRFLQLLKDGLFNDVSITSRLSREETLKLLYFLHLLDLLNVSKPESDPGVKEPPADVMGEDQGVSNEVNTPQEDVITLEEEIVDTESEPLQAVMDNDRLERFKVSNNEEIKADELKKEKKQVLTDEILRLHSVLNQKNYYELLGVNIDSTKEDIRSAYFGLAKKLHPDAHPDFDKDVKQKAEDVFATITAAYQTLSNDESRAQYDSQIHVGKFQEAKSSYDAEIAYRKGEVLLKHRRFDEAMQEFKNAINLSPNEATYIGALAWAVYVGTMDKDRVVHDVKKQLQKAIALNPKLPQNYYYLGCVYKYEESESQAEASFVKALNCDPEYTEAKRELRLIQLRRSEKKVDKGKDKKEKGFWPNLFNK